MHEYPLFTAQAVRRKGLDAAPPTTYGGPGCDSLVQAFRALGARLLLKHGTGTQVTLLGTSLDAATVEVRDQGGALVESVEVRRSDRLLRVREG